MSTRRLVVTIGTAVSLALAAAPAAHADVSSSNDVPAGSVTKSAGAVSATLSWKSGSYAVTDPRLAISRNGTLISDLSLRTVCHDCLFAADTDPSDGYTVLSVADLNGDGEPEISVDTFSGGAHCCTVQRIYGYRGGRYRRTLSQPWGNVGYTITDLDGDGTAEISGSDDGFAYAFSSFASSVFPPKVLRYVINSGTGHAHVRNVTRGYPKRIRSQVFHVRKAIRSARRDPAYETQGLLAGYVADEYLLRHGSTGIREIARARKRGLVQRGFQGHLLKLLKRYRYR